VALRRGVLLFGMVVGLAPGLARGGVAEAPAVRVGFTWDRGDDETCPSQPEIEALIEQRIGRAVFAGPGGAATVRVIGSVSKRPGPRGWIARIELSDAGGNRLGLRTLETDDERCASIAEGVVIVTTVMLDFAAQTALRSAPRAPKVAEAEAEPPPSAPARPLEIELGAALEGSLGEGPAVGLGPRVSLLLRSRFALYAGYRTAPIVAKEQVTTSVGNLGVGACVTDAGEGARPRASACGAFEAGFVRARASGYARGDPGTGLWLAPAIGAQLSGPIAWHLRWNTGVSAALPLIRDRFVLERGAAHAVLFQPDRIAVRGHVGIVWALD
jgi:hypothetical protein